MNEKKQKDWFDWLTHQSVVVQFLVSVLLVCVIGSVVLMIDSFFGFLGLFVFVLAFSVVFVLQICK